MENKFKELAFKLLKVPTLSIDEYNNVFNFRWENQPYFYEICYDGNTKTLELVVGNNEDFGMEMSEEINISDKEDLQIRSIFVVLQEKLKAKMVSDLEQFVTSSTSEIDKLLDDSADE